MKKKSIKRLGLLLLTGSLTLTAAFPAFARGEDWHLDENGWWYGSTGPAGASSYASLEWKYINGEWYFFNEAGYMVTGWVDWNGARYYLNPDSGAMLHDITADIGGLSYTFDSSGATSQVWPYKSPVVIPPDSEKSDVHKALDAMCDSVLGRITNASMSDRQKAEAIYNWIRGNFRYSGHSATRDWVTEAYQGMRKYHGDCYTYFSVSQALLTRAGLPSIEVIRNTDNDHWWNMTMVDGAWYHFDTTPRSWGGRFCLLTDSQMWAYSNAHHGCFHFDRNLYPPTP